MQSAITNSADIPPSIVTLSSGASTSVTLQSHDHPIHDHHSSMSSSTPRNRPSSPWPASISCAM